MKKFTMLMSSVVSVIVLSGCSSESDAKATVTGYMKAINQGSYTNTSKYATKEIVDSMVMRGVFAASMTKKPAECRFLSTRTPISDQPVEEVEKCFLALYKDKVGDFEIQSAQEKNEKHYVVEYIVDAKVASLNVRNIKDKWVVAAE